MGWIKQENSKWVSWDKAKKGYSVEGLYRGSEISQYNKPYYKLKSDEGNLNVPGSGLLDWLMEDAQYPIGSYIMIEYQGKKDLEKGQYKGAAAYQFQISHDPDRDELADRPVATQTTNPDTLESFVDGE